MNIKKISLRVCTLVLMGFILIEPCKSNNAAASPRQEEREFLFLIHPEGISNLPVPLHPGVPPRVMILANETPSPDPEVHIPERSPLEKEVSTELPESPRQELPPGEESSVQLSSPPMPPPKSELFLSPIPEPVLSPEAMDPSVSSPVLPSGSAISSTPELSLPKPTLGSEGSPPIASSSDPQTGLPSLSVPVIMVRPADPVSAPVKAPSLDPSSPPDSPTPVTAGREPFTLPVNSLPEPPARISSNITGMKREEASQSSTVSAIVGQLVEIPLRGTGWVYLGEQGNRRGITYNSRRLEKEGQNFIFHAESAGTYTLTFYKQDFIEDYILNNYVQVIVRENPVLAGTNRFSAEPPVPLVPEDIRGDLSSGAPSSAASSNPPQVQAPGIVPPLPVDYLQQAREAYTRGKFPQVIALLDQFREQYPAGSDEAWWLYGQSFEANDPSRDIRSALDYYRRLIREYPQSPRGTDARRRISYLERYYFNIQ